MDITLINTLPYELDGPLVHRSASRRAVNKCPVFGSIRCHSRTSRWNGVDDEWLPMATSIFAQLYFSLSVKSRRRGTVKILLQTSSSSVHFWICRAGHCTCWRNVMYVRAISRRRRVLAVVTYVQRNEAPSSLTCSIDLLLLFLPLAAALLSALVTCATSMQIELH